MCACVCVSSAKVHMWRTEDKLQVWKFSPDSRNWTQAVRLDGKCLYHWTTLLSNDFWLCASRVTHVICFPKVLSFLSGTFCSCCSISFVEDCQCLVHHYSNSTIIKSEDGLRLLSTRMTGIHHHTWLYYVQSTCLASICSSCTTPLEFSQSSFQQRQNHVCKTSLGGWRDRSDLLICREEHGGSSRKPEFDSQHPYGGS